MTSEKKTAPEQTSSPAHFVAMEEKMMFQQRAIEELNSVVLKQQDELEQLRIELGSMRSTMQGLIDRGTGEDLPHEKPPHY